MIVVIPTTKRSTKEYSQTSLGSNEHIKCGKAIKRATSGCMSTLILGIT